jgi:hypothetical protein
MLLALVITAMRASFRPDLVHHAARMPSSMNYGEDLAL